MRTYTHNLQFGLELPKVRTEPRGEEKRLSQANAELIHFREILQTERCSATVVWEERNGYSTGGHHRF